MGVDAVYLLDEKKQIRRVIVWGVYELIHDEATYELDAEIASEYDAGPGEFLAFFDVDAHLRLFEIDSAEKDERRGVTAVVATDAAVAELAHLIVPEIRLTGATEQQAAQETLAGSGWQLGEASAAGKSDLNAYRDKRWKVLRDIAVQYQARVTPYFVIKNGEIVGKIVDVTARENVFRGRLFEGTNGSAQIYVKKSGPPVTKMYGIGKAIGTEDPPTCVTFADVEAPDKPKGQTYIEDADAIALYGEGREAVFSDKYIEDPNELLEKTRAELKKRSRPKVSGTATASDMEHIPGYEHMIVRLYDLVWVRTKTGEDLQAVVINVKRNYLRRGLTKITIGEEADDSGLIAKIAKLSSTTSSLGRSSSAASNRYIETKQLIQLNADTIQMNARLIEANAEEIRMTAEALDEAKIDLTARVKKNEEGLALQNEALLRLRADTESATAVLAAQVSKNEQGIATQNQAILTLRSDMESANASLAARVSKNEAGISTQNSAILDLRADLDSAEATLAARMSKTEADVKLQGEAILELQTGAGESVASLAARIKKNEEDIETQNEAMLTLRADLESAEADLHARVERVEGDVTLTNEAVLTLRSDLDDAEADLSARVETVEGGVKQTNEAVLSLKADTESATASLAARVGDNEASITLHASELGTLAEIKADRVDLGKYATVEQLEAERAEIDAGISRVVTTNVLNVLNNANFTSSSISVGGTGLTLKSKDYVKSVGRTKRYCKSPADITIEIWEISSISNGTLNYLGYD